MSELHALAPDTADERSPRPERSHRPPQGFRLPGSRDRIAVTGRTGSGKTHFATWLLSRANWTSKPWVMIDYKRDQLLAQIPRVEELRLGRRPPRHAGLYAVHPRPDEAEAVETLLMRIWERGATGLYVDEAHILPDRGGLQAILTQGRSKQIPAIIVSQRPVHVNRFVFSEADFYSLFHLNDKRDRQTIGAFVPIDLERSLPERHSWYHDVSRNRSYRMLPVPGQHEILDRFDLRGGTRWRKI